MGIARGPNLIKDNLVSGYDTGYGIADPGLSTRFYKGRPTVNLGADRVATLHDSSGGAAATVVDAPEKGVGWKKVTITARGTNFRVIQFGSYVNFAANTLYSESFEADWGNMRGKGYNLTFDGSGGGSRNWFKNRSYATGVTSNIAVDSTLLDGHIGGNITKSSTHVHVWFLYNNSTSTTGLNDYFYYKDLQIEVGTIPTPYVDGTRSDTASLIDLKRTASINVSNMSFDITGQPEMDGSSDYVDLGSDIAISSVANAASNGWTAEYVFNSDTAEVLQHFNGCEEDTHNAGWLALYQSRLQVWDRTSNVWKMGDTVFASNTWYHIAFVQVNGTTMQFYVNGVAEGGNHVGFAWTAAKSAFFARYVGRYEFGGYSRYFNGHIPVTRLYSKALTASEIKVNFDAFKNRFNI
tara:strand:- start:4614 stop:5840 length:1227 start_codon:yes stop_codon:yes gene_type:complete